MWTLCCFGVCRHYRNSISLTRIWKHRNWEMQELVDVIIKVFCIFQSLVLTAYGYEFLSASNQSKILISTQIHENCLQCSIHL